MGLLILVSPSATACYNFTQFQEYKSQRFPNKTFNYICLIFRMFGENIDGYKYSPSVHTKYEIFVRTINFLSNNNGTKLYYIILKNYF